MKLKMLIIAICFFSASVLADTNNQRRGISTVDDVKEVRALMIKRMNTRLTSGDLSDKQVNFLMKRIVNLETRPLPTQEQIDWRKENREAVKSSRGQKGKGHAGKKRKYLQKRRNHKS